MVAAAWVCALAVLVLLFGERRGERKIVWVGKPVASTAFVVGAASVAMQRPSRYATVMLIAFVLSWLGDVLLIPQSKRSFLCGIAAFLFAHVAFIVAFLRLGTAIRSAAAAFVLLSVFGGVVAQRLAARLTATMRIAVFAYIATIVLMAASAIGTLRPLVIGGAIAFFVSDLFVARQRFVQKSFVNKAIGLPLYYLAQFLLIATL